MRWLCSLAVLLTTSPAYAFEGEIDAKTIGDGAPVNLQIYVSERGDVRMDSTSKDPDGNVQRASYIKPTKGKYNFTLDHDRKVATKVPKDALAHMTGASSGDEDAKPNVEVKKLGTETVAAQKTRHIRVIDKDDGDTADFWLSDRYSVKLWETVFGVGGTAGRGSSGQLTQVLGKHYGLKPGFVMKVESTTEGGQRGGLEVTRIQKKKVPSSRFVVPTGYSVAELPGLPGGATQMKTPANQEEAEKMREEWLKKMQEMQKKQQKQR